MSGLRTPIQVMAVTAGYGNIERRCECSTCSTLRRPGISTTLEWFFRTEGVMSSPAWVRNPGRGPLLPPGITAEAIGVQLDRILASPLFAQADSLRRLLRHLVEQTLQERAGQLKEYTLA